MEIHINNGEPMYFIGQHEVSQPEKLDTPVTLKDGRIVVAIAYGRKNHILCANDIEGIQVVKTIPIPDWLLPLSKQVKT